MPIIIEEAKPPSETLNESCSEQSLTLCKKRLLAILSWNFIKGCISVFFDILLLCILIVAIIYFYKHRQQVFTTCVKVELTQTCTKWP